MENTHRISTYCLIRNNKVICDSEIRFSVEKSVSTSDFFKELYRYQSLEYPKFHKMDLLCKGSFLATEFIVEKQPITGQNVPLIISNFSSSGVSDSKHAQMIYREEDALASPSVFVYTLPNILMGEISIRHKLHSENIFYIFDSFNAGFLTKYNEQILASGKAEKILSGWVEVTEESFDIFLYLVEKKGKYLHSKEQILELYKQKL
ncbi:hypothetical protein [Apibacter sp. HY039]|uniref:hypothetical protein n=1 Tax=Apibacter sp. HY039 TaxID=2501476 RepID=UPI000FEBFFB2|nr:hypothetical protein [Apibacter sp. HY039]